MTFQEKFSAGWKAGKFVCVGIDPRMDKIPACVPGGRHGRDKLRHFCWRIAQATGPHALAFKPNLAFFLQMGGYGVDALEELCAYIREEFPDVVLILDAKYGDIDDTNEAYAEFAFDRLGVDAVTLNPYVGGKAHEPFLRRADKGCIFLVKTSNPGAAELQDRLVIVEGPELAEINETPTGGMVIHHRSGAQMLRFHQLVAHRITHSWNTHGNCGVVVGATYPGDLSTVRTIIGGRMPILIPGIGAQGGALRETVSEAMGSGGDGMVISNSRGIIHASIDEDFAEAAAAAMLGMNRQIMDFRGVCDFPA